MSTSSPQKKSGASNVDRKTLISRALDRHPDAAAIYRELKLPCNECNAAEVETLEQGAKLLGMDAAALDRLIERLNALPPAPDAGEKATAAGEK